MNAQPIEDNLRSGRHIAPMPEQSARADRQKRNELRPFFIGEACAGQGRGRYIRFGITYPANEAGIANPAPAFAHNPRPIGNRDRIAQCFEPEKRRHLKAFVPACRRFAQQVEQLPILRPSRPLACGAVAQHGGKAVVEVHCGSQGEFGQTGKMPIVSELERHI